VLFEIPPPGLAGLEHLFDRADSTNGSVRRRGLAVQIDIGELALPLIR
jgi:hypothetical protein